MITSVKTIFVFYTVIERSSRKNMYQFVKNAANDLLYKVYIFTFIQKTSVILQYASVTFARWMMHKICITKMYSLRKVNVMKNIIGLNDIQLFFDLRNILSIHALWKSKRLEDLRLHLYRSKWRLLQLISNQMKHEYQLTL